ncbi:MAG TPA: DUF2173 family protein [Chromatiales bacterium]|nr:DUF2173 family protein [Chromatiales bacterium]
MSAPTSPWCRAGIVPSCSTTSRPITRLPTACWQKWRHDMLERMLDVPGVIAVAQYKDMAEADLMQAHGSLDMATMKKLGRFAYDHKRMTQGMVDVFGMFKPTCCARDWTPQLAWVVRGKSRSICGWAGLVCVIDNDKASLNQVLKKLGEIAFMI